MKNWRKNTQSKNNLIQGRGCIRVTNAPNHLLKIRKHKKRSNSRVHFRAEIFPNITKLKIMKNFFKDVIFFGKTEYLLLSLQAWFGISILMVSAYYFI